MLSGTSSPTLAANSVRLLPRNVMVMLVTDGVGVGVGVGSGVGVGVATGAALETVAGGVGSATLGVF